MNTEHIIRAWRDEEYRESLDADQLAMLPESPVGSIELVDSELAEVDGGSGSACWWAATAVFAILANNDHIDSWASGGTCRMNTDGCC